MDTPDRAASLADPEIADSLNREWLIASGGSSQLSTDLRRYQLEWSSLSVSINESSSNDYGSIYHSQRAALGCTSKRSTNHHHHHLYDNISFADSPLLARSISRKASFQESATDQDNPSRAGGGCFRGKFRIFLASYLLLGITLAIYSRNALSLAAVAMVANNVANKELITVLTASSAATKLAASSNLTSNMGSKPIMLDNLGDDGSCRISDPQQISQQDASNERAASFILSRLPPGLDVAQSSQFELEQAFKTSIKNRIEQGDLVDWTPSEQGLIFAAGSVGNLLIAIPLTRVGEIYGPKWIIFVAVLGATIQAALMPIISPLHISLVILFQIIFSGLTFGADCVAYTLFAYWLTPTEMAFFVACLVVCYQMGAILSSFVSAYILTQGIAWSWCFYFPAILCGIWTIVWMFIGASEPSKSFIISKEELNYLTLRSKLSQASDEIGPNGATDHSISWLKLARDPNIWAIIGVKFTLRWYFSVNLSLMPTYLSSVAHMSIDTIGKMSAFQSIIGLVSGVYMGFITKSVVSKRPFGLSLPAFRKIFQSVVNFGLALSLIIFTIFDCNQWVTIITLTVAGVCINFYVAAALQLPLDLSPSHCGLITSITNTLALGQAIGAPISGLILNSAPKDRTLWRIVWGVSIVLNILSGLLFIMLVDSKPRDYSKTKAKEGKFDWTTKNS